MINQIVGIIKMGLQLGEVGWATMAQVEKGMELIVLGQEELD